MQEFVIHGQFKDNDTLQVSHVSLCSGAYIGFNAYKYELGFGTKTLHVNDGYHIIQGIYVEKTFTTLRYEGQEMNGKMAGLGRVTFYKDIPGTYEGRLKNDTFDGKGKFVYPDGKIYSGTYKDHHKWTGELTKAKDTTRYCSEKYKDGNKVEC